MRKEMKNLRVMVVALGLTLGVLGTGCLTTGPNTQRGAMTGAAVGAITGAVIGHQTGNTAEGAAVGGAIGALGGGAYGQQQDKINQAQQGYYYQQ